MNTVLQLINLLASFVTLAVTVRGLLEFRKERPIRALSLFISALLSLLILAAFTRLSGARLTPLLGVPILALGVLIGFLRGLATRLYRRDGKVLGKNSMLFLLGWGGSLAMAQLLNMLGSALASSLGLMPLLLSTGTQVGISGNLFLRRVLMRSPAPGTTSKRPPPDLPT